MARRPAGKPIWSHVFQGLFGGSKHLLHLMIAGLELKTDDQRRRAQQMIGGEKRFFTAGTPDAYVNIIDMGDDSDAPLGFLLYRVGAALRPEVSAVLRPLGLTLPEFVCLRILSLFPGLSSAELSRQTNVTPQAMNMVLRKLEDVGAVARPESVASGRALPATLTGRGRALLKRAEAAVRVADGHILAKLSEPQQREFKRMLEKLGSD